MIRPSHAAKSFTARRVFTDREEAIEQFMLALNKAQEPHAYRVLVFHGVGGQGKSELKCQFELSLEREVSNGRRLGWAVIDFADPRHRTIDQALLAIRLQLAKCAGVAFPAFDTAFARYFALDNPGVDMRKRHPELFKGESEVLNELINLASTAADAVPGLSLLYKYGARGGWYLKEWWDRRGKRVLLGLDELKAYELLEKLPTYLGADLCDALAAGHPPRLIILIDTYEALWRDHPLKAGVEALRADAWVRLLVQDAPGILFALFGRDRLHWGELNAAWDDIVKQPLLGRLSDPDADRFLQQVPIADASVRARIIAAAEGLPFYLELSVDTFEQIVNQKGTPRPEDFGDSKAEVVARFLDHLERGEVETIKLAAYARVLKKSLLLHLVECFLGGAARAEFGRLADYSFMTPQTDGRLVMHALMREGLQQRERAERPELFRCVHEALFRWHDARCQP